MNRYNIQNLKRGVKVNLIFNKNRGNLIGTFWNFYPSDNYSGEIATVLLDDGYIEIPYYLISKFDIVSKHKKPLLKNRG